MKKALITGIAGQDGGYLAEHLLQLGYEVHGIARGLAYTTLQQMHVIPGVHIHVADMRDTISLETVFRRTWPDEVYNLAGQVYVPASWTQPEETFDVNVNGLLRLLKLVNALKPDTKIYQASSSEMFGNSGNNLTETSLMRPVSPYGVSKLAAHQLVDVYRKRGTFICSGILFNHESPRRGPEMVTRKITRTVGKWVCGDWEELRLGHPDAVRDWGFAGDYVKAMHLMLQHPVPDDYVIGTGETHTVAEFVEEAIAVAGLSYRECLTHVNYNSPEFMRQNELFHLQAYPLKAKRVLGWRVETPFKKLVRLMVEADVVREKRRHAHRTEVMVH